MIHVTRPCYNVPMFDRQDDTIVAISSPPGVSARGLLRLSGPGALAIAAQAFHPCQETNWDELSGRTVLNGHAWIDPADPLTQIPAKLFLFRAPHSYTRQDVVEIHAPGASPVLGALLDQCTRAGARQADPGEFTARAFFAGAMDLTRVEGVAAVIQARNDSQLRASEALLQGRLSQRTHELRERLADLLALLEAEIDFVEEPIDFVSSDQVAATLAGVMAELDDLVRRALSAESLEVLPEVVLVGRPNAGKSTLLNRLTGMDRAIASATAGTTRDVLRAPMALGSGEIMLSDTAGLPGSPGSPNPGMADTISAPDRLAQSMTSRSLTTADLILIVVDLADSPGGAMADLTPSLPPGRPRLIVANKMDRLPEPARSPTVAQLQVFGPVVPVSALTGEGLPQLRARLDEMLGGGMEGHGTELLTLSQRQRSVLAEALGALHRALEITGRDGALTDAVELLALEVREAMTSLSLLTGEVTTEDLLGRIFSRFCIGK